MDVEIRQECDTVDWAQVSALLKRVGMAYHDPQVHRKAFEASYTAAFAYHDGRLVGFGRAISDGAYQAAIYDCAVMPVFQGKGIGAKIMQAILSRISHCNIMLYAAPGKEGFYEKYGFRRMKTGMARFTDAARMKEHGFTE